MDMRPFEWFVGGFVIAAGVGVCVWATRRVAARRVYRRIAAKRGGGSYGGGGDGGGRYRGGYGEEAGWDSDDAELSDELIDAVGFSLLEGSTLREGEIRGFDDSASDSDSNIEVGKNNVNSL